MKRLAACLAAGFLLAATGCGASGSGAAVTRSSSSPTGSPTAPASARARGVVQAYWNDIAAGRFRAAFLRFDAAERRRVHGRHWFIADKARDAPIRVRVRLGGALVNGRLATVPIVSLRTVGSLTGCHRWTGSYRLRDIRSHWLIDATTITRHSC